MPFLPQRLTAALLTTALTGAGLALVSSSPASAAGDAVDLGSASAFAVLASSTVTNTGSTVVTGDLGLAPGTSVTGFPPGQVIGTTHVADATAVQAQTDARTAYTTATGLAGTAAAPVQLGGTRLLPGVYDGGALDLTGNLVLDAQGDADAVFVLRATTTLTTAASSTVTLEGSASACHVFWAVGSSATLGADSTFAGTIDAQTSVSVDARAAVTGRLLALTGAVTLIENSITRPVCAAAVVAAPAASPTATTAPPTTAAPAPVVTSPTPSPTPTATASPTPTATASPTPTAATSPTASPTAAAASPATSPSPSTASTTAAAPLRPAPATAPALAPAPDSALLSDGAPAAQAAPGPVPQAPAAPQGPGSPDGPTTGLPVTGLAVREVVGAGGLALLLGAALMAAGSTPAKHRRPLLRGRTAGISA